MAQPITLRECGTKITAQTMTECFNKLTFARAWCAVYEDVDSATRSFEGMAKVGLQYVDEWLYMFVIIHAQFWCK